MSLSENPSTDLAYQKAILGSVSRTFALTIPLLPPMIEKVVGNTYLLCRIVDTIEDAADLSPQTKQNLSQLFLDAVLPSIFPNPNPHLSFIPSLKKCHLVTHPDDLFFVAL